MCWGIVPYFSSARGAAASSTLRESIEPVDTDLGVSFVLVVVVG